MAEATAPSPAGQSPHTGALNLTDITRERIDIGLIAAGDDLGVHISQEESLENPVESQPETQTQDSTATTTAPVTASRNKFSYSKRKLTGSRDLFLKDAYRGLEAITSNLVSDRIGYSLLLSIEREVFDHHFLIIHLTGLGVLTDYSFIFIVGAVRYV